MVLPRPVLFGFSLLLAPLLLHCSRGYSPPPLQSTDLDVDRGEIQQFEGRWFESFDGYLMVIVQGGERPQFSIRLPEKLRLKSARLEQGDLLFRFQGSESEGELCLRPVADNVIVAIRPGGHPSWCGSCTPYFQRNRPLWEIVRLRARFAIEAFQVAYEATEDWLVDVF